jgi:hypothetical protein
MPSLELQINVPCDISEVNMPREQIFSEIEAERIRQDSQWGGAQHDDTHSVENWSEYIDKQTYYANECGDSDLADARQRFVKAAALAVAAIESIDRRLS